ncbi:MAG: hypothetical protein R3190_06130, partial [Thermoanaerobaculia bacterium]|nr:hypothetical protein [Thermoanaerobaculia bacterium]
MTRISLADVLCVLLLAGIAAFGFELRFESLGGPSLWYDEVLHDDRATVAGQEEWYRWLTGMAHVDRENGPLFYGSQLLARRLASGETAARLFPAAAGFVVVPVVAWCAWLVAGRTAAVLAGLLIAASPLAVHFAREARPYSAILLATALALLAFLRPSDRLSKALIYVACIAGAYMGAIAVPTIAAVGLVATVELLLAWRRGEGIAAAGRLHHFAAAAISTLLVFVLYVAPDTGVGDDRYAIDFEGERVGPAPWALVNIRQVVSAWTISGAELDRWSPWSLLHLAIVALGVWHARRLRPRRTAETFAFAVLTGVFAFLALIAVGHWYSPRYAIAAMAPLLVLEATGLAAVAAAIRRAGRRLTASVWPRLAAYAAITGIALLLVRPNVEAARAQPYMKDDWKGMRAVLDRFALPGEQVVAGDHFAAHNLRYYLRGTGLQVVRGRRGPLELQAIADECGACWFTPGLRYGRIEDEMMAWFRGLYEVAPDLYFSPDWETFLETRLAGDASDWVRERAGSRRLDLGPEDAFRLDGVWHLAERSRDISFRWAGDEVAVAIQVAEPTDSVLRYRAYAFAYPEAPQQAVEVEIGGGSLGSQPLGFDWEEHNVFVPQSRLRSGLNVVRFRFAHTASP